ncbi:NUAK SNF1-like kinase 1 [Rhizoclosmatium sp. JEL0117]|nr:NUAK SNF1-like kinase 1 [Rhizoclosmatium sp. JEL0117]
MSNILYSSSVPELSGLSAGGGVGSSVSVSLGQDHPHLHELASRLHQSNQKQLDKLQGGSATADTFQPCQQPPVSSLGPTQRESEATLADEEIAASTQQAPLPNYQPPPNQQQQPHLFYQPADSTQPHPQPQKYIPATIEPRVGDYILTDTIGEGTFGKVKLGIHFQTGEKCAVKAIQKSKIKTVKQMNSVQREVRLMKLLKHPHIVDVKETFEDGDQIFLVMEYASGGELFDYIAQQCQQDENMARVYFRQVVSAINYCHQNSIIHRDLKPENLLLDKNGNIKIIDFGFGNTFHRDRTLDTYCGSPYYAAPEMVKGIPYTGPEVDMWSLGVILYALITGNLPFDSRDMSILYALIAKGEYEPIKSSDTANHLVSTMLTVNPLMRAKMNEVMDHPWTNYGYTEKIQSFIIVRPTVVNNPSQAAIAELVSYGISEREIRRLLNIDCGLHPIKSLYFLVSDYLDRVETHKLRPQQMQGCYILQPPFQPQTQLPQHQQQQYPQPQQPKPMDEQQTQRSITPVKRKETVAATPPKPQSPAPSMSQKGSPGSRLLKALTTSLRKKKSRKDEDSETTPKCQDDTPRVSRIVDDDAPRNSIRQSVFSPPPNRGGPPRDGSSDSLERLRNASNGVTTTSGRVRESNEGSEAVWGMKWTSAHREPEECTDSDCDEAAANVRASTTVPPAPVMAKKGPASLVHRLFGKK